MDPSSEIVAAEPPHVIIERSCSNCHERRGSAPAALSGLHVAVRCSLDAGSPAPVPLLAVSQPSSVPPQTQARSASASRTGAPQLCRLAFSGVSPEAAAVSTAASLGGVWTECGSCQCKRILVLARFSEDDSTEAQGTIQFSGVPEWAGGSLLYALLPVQPFSQELDSRHESAQALGEQYMEHQMLYRPSTCAS